MILKDSDGKTMCVGEETLLVFLDETGNELLNDPKMPVFGLGGLIVEHRKYFSNVEQPWHEIKNSKFGGFDKPLHASELISPSDQQIKALNNFFLTNDFGRFAVVCSNQITNETTHSIVEIICAQLWSTIKEVANKMSWTDILILIEENKKLRSSLESQFLSKNLYNNSTKINFQYYTHLKDPKFAGLEVADFIIHTAGRQARNDCVSQKPTKASPSVKADLKPDFQNVFFCGSNNHYFYIDKVKSKF
ncbi:MAG: DUF3800 domain-containing protein [Bdellovibrionota bacterium]